MDKIIIKNILARGIIGVNDSERDKPQDILINIDLYTTNRKAEITGWYKRVRGLQYCDEESHIPC